MTTFFLVRHAVHELGADILAGRSDVQLSREGKDQAHRLSRRLAARDITGVQSSPRARTRQTAEAAANATGLGIEIIEAADEVDFGEWTGKSFAQLEGDPRWRAWNTTRGTALTPGGERMADIARRIAAHMDALREMKPDGRIVIVTHAEVIRGALMHYLGMPLANFSRLDIEPASIATLVAGEWGVKLTGLNEREI